MSTTPTPDPTTLASGPPATDPTAGDRPSWIAKNSTRLIIALAVIAALSSACGGDSSANPGDSVASGIMEEGNDQGAILTAAKMLPGDTATGKVSITNVGEAAGAFSLSASDLADNPADPAFSEVLTLVVKDGSTTVYEGLLSEFPQPGSTPENIDLGTWEAAEHHDYTFTVTFDESAGNEYQDAVTTLSFNWDATDSTS
jgi:hypothetical protein